ncbi:inositol oxygenase-like [Lineus longissimus]|uniref:inositol oxygenase-like n=1 Tax=Lineus longissimus TaxID=88925 RepID=UPI002B4C93B1
MATVQVSAQPKITLPEPGALPKTDRNVDDFRNFKDSTYQERVERTYRLMHTNQTVDFVKNRLAFWKTFHHDEKTIMEACDLLNELVDETDPDLGVPNAIHAFQTAEKIREAHPDEDWFHLTGFIHDIGKVMAMWGEEQWATCGDTYPVGCRPSDQVAFGLESFKDNPDMKHDVFSTKMGMYKENCGLENVLMSWGHDEYFYHVLKNSPSCSLPEEAFYMIRFHSFYPWHTGGDYDYLVNDKDRKMLPWIREFNKFDLYSKSETLPDMDALRPYYQSLIDKYVPGKIRF